MISHDQINSLIDKHNLCSRCVLRIINAKVRDFDEYETNLPKKIETEKLIEEMNCLNCHGIVSRLLSVSAKLLDRLNKIEFNSFLVGTRLTGKYKQIDQLIDNSQIPVYLIKQEIIREFQNTIKARFPVQLKHDFPVVTILLEMRSNPRFSLDIRSLYILGKYRKLKRGIPQTKWPCTHCKGRKCEKCNFTGQQYPQSVELLVAEPFITASESLNSSFHGAGREDIDALMLGEGRPFVLELKQPRKRSLELKILTDMVNQNPEVNIHLLRYCPKDTIEIIKAESQFSTKTYRALVQTSEEITTEQLNKLSETEFPLLIKQRTPIRVSHRRADLVREKTIYSVEMTKMGSNTMELVITAQGGTYIKEFISSDEGRSIPSISSILGQSALCKELDVRDVDDKGLFQ